MLGDGDKLNRIEELKSKLFSKNYKMKLGHVDKFTSSAKKNIPDSWEGDKTYEGETGKFFMKTPIFKNFFIFSLIFFGLTLLYAAYVFFAGGNTVSNENIEISVVGNNYTAGGEELSFVVSITNKNNSSLDLADLILEYPKSSSAEGGDPSLGVERNRVSLGTIPAGAVRNENLKVVLFGEQGTVVSLKLSLEYRVEGSNAIFIKKKNYDVTVSSTPLNLSLDAPTEVSTNQDITLKVKATLNATRAIPKILVRADYPVGFVFASAVPAPSFGNNVWNLGDVSPGAERNIVIKGKMQDVVDGEEKNFRISAGSQSERDKSAIGAVFNSISHLIAIKKPFIEARLSINGASGREYSIDSKTPIRGEIRWTNNLDTKVNELSIRAKISGNAVNRRTINAENGFYNSLEGEDVIIWDKSSDSLLAEVNPGESGTVGFTLSSLSLFSAGAGMLVDPTIKVDISISGKQLVSGYATQDLANSDSGTIRIISDVGFTTKALHFSGPFVNTGPIPPKVASKTTYTVTWSLSNTSNSISKGMVRSSLPSWISFVGPISPAGENLVYNPSTREIVWNAGRILKGAGITTAEKTVSFQIAFTPSLSQAGSMPVLINEAILTGHDDFANVEIRVSKGSLRTSLEGDPGLPQGGGTVVE